MPPECVCNLSLHQVIATDAKQMMGFCEDNILPEDTDVLITDLCVCMSA